MSTTPTHTPGPWVYLHGMVFKRGADYPPHFGYPPTTDNGIPIARMDREPGNGTTPTERDANARLIAAAPGMFASLRECAKQLRLMGAIGHAQVAQAIIDEATGASQ